MVSSLARPERAGATADGSSRTAACSIPNLLAMCGSAGPRAVRAAEELPVYRGSVTHDLAPAVVAHRCGPMNGAFERVKHVYRAADVVHLARQRVVVAAYLTYRHDRPPKPVPIRA